MNLIDRYIHQVGRRLPRRQRADVEAELSSLFQDTIDDRYQGEPSQDEIVTLLKEFGSPDQVAASYRPSAQYLIGPELYPTFKIVIGAVLLALTIGLTVAYVLGGLFGPSETSDIVEQILRALGGYIQAVLSALGSVVLVFAILQRFEVNLEEREVEWDPLDLPDVKDYDVVGRGETVAGIAFGVVFLILLNVFSDRIGLVITLGQEPLLSEIVQDNLVWLNLAVLLGLGLNVILLWQGRWHLVTRLANVVIDLLWLYIIYQIAVALAASKELLVEAGLVEPLPTILTWLGYWILIVVAIAFIINTGKWLYQALGKPKKMFKLGRA
jgi:hypothetical protein